MRSGSKTSVYVGLAGVEKVSEEQRKSPDFCLALVLL
jgi:hypothetical protein